MATCIKCKKCWNSWGSDDKFCSTACEDTRRIQDKEIAQELFRTMNDEEIKRLEHLLSSQVGIDAMDILLQDLLKK